MKSENDNYNNFNNIMNPLYKNQKYVDDSIENIIKANMNLSPKTKAKNHNKKISKRNPIYSSISEFNKISPFKNNNC